MDVSIYRLRSRDVLTLCVLSLLLLGIMMVQSASMHVYQDAKATKDHAATSVENRKWSWTEPGTKQVQFAVVALLTFWFVGRIDYTNLLRGTNRFWRNPILWGVAIAGMMCLVVLVPHIGIEK